MQGSDEAIGPDGSHSRISTAGGTEGGDAIDELLRRTIRQQQGLLQAFVADASGSHEQVQVALRGGQLQVTAHQAAQHVFRILRAGNLFRYLIGHAPRQPLGESEHERVPVTDAAIQDGFGDPRLSGNRIQGDPGAVPGDGALRRSEQRVASRNDAIATAASRRSAAWTGRTAWRAARASRSFHHIKLPWVDLGVPPSYAHSSHAQGGEPVMATVEEQTPVHLRGNGRPTQEERTLTELKVTGSIPTELDGRYVRNGANPLSGTSIHPFLGDGMLHGVRLRNGRAEWYRNRYVRTPFITNPDRNALDPATGMDMTASKANTHVVGHGGRILALEEGHFPYVVDGNLETVGPTDFDGVLTGSFTAHPKICPATGEMLAFGYSAMPPYLRYLRVSADGKLVQTENISVGGPTMMHDFNVTRNYVIFMDLPAVFDMSMAMKGELPIRWDDNYPARLGVMPRNGSDGDVRWFDINPCYVFHPMNSYEDGDRIVLDVARFSHIWRDSAMDFPPPCLWRWTIDTVSGKVHEEQIDDRPAEFPRVADAVIGLKHRYGYMMGMSAAFGGDSARIEGALLKYDRETGQSCELRLGKGSTPGEPVFAPAANARNEDDGYLMTYVHDAGTDTSRYMIFDAASMDSEPMASIELPRIPSGFHGSWIPASVAD